MKKTILLIALAIATNVSFAQKGNSKTKTSEQITTDKVAKMKAELSLTDNQTAKITPLMLQKINTIQANEKKIAKAKREIKKANKTFHTEMEAILTDEQKASLKEKKDAKDVKKKKK